MLLCDKQKHKKIIINKTKNTQKSILRIFLVFYLVFFPVFSFFFYVLLFIHNKIFSMWYKQQFFNNFKYALGMQTTATTKTSFIFFNFRNFSIFILFVIKIIIIFFLFMIFKCLSKGIPMNHLSQSMGVDRRRHVLKTLNGHHTKVFIKNI